MSFSSIGGTQYWYLTPKSSVRFGLTFQVSWTKNSRRPNLRFRVTSRSASVYAFARPSRNEANESPVPVIEDVPTNPWVCTALKSNVPCVLLLPFSFLDSHESSPPNLKVWLSRVQVMT